jgi:hypothetical protein
MELEKLDCYSLSSRPVRVALSGQGVQVRMSIVRRCSATTRVHTVANFSFYEKESADCGRLFPFLARQ